MKIILVNNLYHPYKIGGAEFSVRALAEELVSIGLHVGVITLGTSEESYEIDGVRVWRLKIENNYWPHENKEHPTRTKLIWHYLDTYNKKYQVKYCEIFDEFKPDVVHTNNLSGFSTSIWNFAKLKNIPVIHTLRDYYLQCPKSIRFRNNQNCYKQCFDCKLFSLKKKSCSYDVDAVIGLSQFILDKHLSEGYFKNSSINKVVFNGFRIPAKLGFKPKFKMSSNINLGFIGQVNQAKGIELLLISLKKLLRQQNWKLFIAGRIDLNYETYLRSFLPHDRIVFLGYTNPEDFFNKIDVLVVPSIWEEPFGRVVIEGMLHNKVVIGSNTGGIRELLKENPTFMFEPNPLGLSTLLTRLFLNPKLLNNFTINPNYLFNFDIKVLGQNYLKVYNELLTARD
ncbi:glycosyltransferase family 4 protein [Arenibacter palladensis]|uniref:glycosyltransferase family 4 protein n=1 Tax=Arenibacter palladensis TaxID=237373 RepID=UPI002FD3B112